MTSNPHNTHSEALKAVWKRYPEICSDLFPKKWHMPPNYYNPEYFLPQAISQLMVAHGRSERDLSVSLEQDPVMAAWLLTFAGLKRYRCRVYAVEPELAKDIMRTSAEGFDFDAVTPYMPLPAFLLSVPKGILTTPADGDVVAIGVSCDSFNPPTNEVKPKTMFCVVAALASGAAYTFITPAITSVMFELLDAKQVRYSRENMDNFMELLETSSLDEDGSIRERLGNFEQADDAEQLHRIALFALNAVAYMSAANRLESDTVEEELSRKAKKRSERNQTPENRRDFYTPWIIGKDYQRIRVGRNTTPSERGTVRMHWRCGHWRRQPYGKGRLERRLIQVPPVMVNAPRQKV